MANRGKFDAALADEIRVRDFLQQVEAAAGKMADTSAQLSFAHKHVGALLIRKHQHAEALKEYEAALALDERWTAAHPDDATAAYNKTTVTAT